LLPNEAIGQQKSLKEQLVESWAYVSSTATMPDGSPLWGTDPKGLMIFTANGRFSWQLFRSDRPKFASKNRMQGTPEENAADGSDAIDLPGARGEVKQDRCYRGRQHLVCTFNALLTEAKTLLENYRRITEAKYPELANLEAVCGIPSATIATDLDKARDFNAKFKSLKLQYEARLACAGSVQQSFRSVTLVDMAQAPDLVKSMMDAIEEDTKGVADIQAQVAGLAERIDASERAMNTLQKVHRAMCAKNRLMDAENRATR